MEVYGSSPVTPITVSPLESALYVTCRPSAVRLLANRKTVHTVLESSFEGRTMPRTNALPKYRKHKASGQAVVTLGGKDHYLGPHASKASVREYDRHVAEWLARGRTALSADPHAVTVAEVLLAYVKFAKVHYRKHGQDTGTWTNQKPTVNTLRSMYGDTPAAEFGPLRLKAFRLELCKPREIRRGDRVEARTATRKHINEQIAIVRRIFRFAVSEQLVTPDVLTALEAVSGLQAGRVDLPEGRRVEPVSDEHVDAVLPFLTPTVRAMVAVQLLSGMRPNEVLQMRPGDLDRSGVVWTYTPARHKTEHHGRQRVVALGPQSQAALLPYLDREPTQFCFVPAESVKQGLDRRHAKRVTPLSCGNRPGKSRKRHRVAPASTDGYTNDAYRRAIHRACDAAGIPRWSPNRLRHSAATKIRARYGLEQARVVLGHSSTTTTEIYAERDLLAASEVARQLG